MDCCGNCDNRGHKTEARANCSVCGKETGDVRLAHWLDYTCSAACQKVLNAERDAAEEQATAWRNEGLGARLLAKSFGRRAHRRGAP